MKALPASLQGCRSFSKQDYISTMSAAYQMSEEQIIYDLRKKLKNGELVRQGWGQYVKASAKRYYSYEYSELSNDIAGRLNQEYDGLNFRIFEYVQLNEFMNHLAGRNTLFLYVENAYVDYVFDLLFDEYPGKVMLKPRIDDYYRYHQDNSIIVNRLPSEAPKGGYENWHIRLEQIIVDMLVDKLISKVIPEEEKKNIIDGIFDTYIVDQNTMIRYAKRKGAEQKFVQAFSQYRKAISK